MTRKMSVISIRLNFLSSRNAETEQKENGVDDKGILKINYKIVVFDRSLKFLTFLFVAAIAPTMSGFHVKIPGSL